ncbi:hypothetical protein E4N62_17000 [Streptomyces sp. MNU76]|uniref:hypothetical protein n=1 Tax=Streptomyces sp. MNU76 TaxID=2560026 RepID=UPI001E2F0A1A|nr:hypothetical protein [Streptomyces sp. MNU76]MCC9706820.1 hypothetical protein [Streptomyces sp. MNU76]
MSHLQALGARRVAAARGDGGARERGRTVVEVLRGWPFLAGAGLDTLGFAAQVVALRLAPVFLVEAAVAASLAVTAVAGTVVLGLRPRRAEWAAVAVVVLGLATLAVSAGRAGDGDGDTALRVAVLVASVLVVAGGWVVGGRLRRGRAVVLGAAAGLSSASPRSPYACCRTPRSSGSWPSRRRTPSSSPASAGTSCSSRLSSPAR